jgi:hypothetical protein
MSLFFPQELTHVTGKARELYRPLKWRGILPVEPVPAWAQVVEDRKMRTLVEDPVNMTNKGPTEELPMPAFSVSNQTIKVFSFGNAYGYTDEDVAYAAHVGISLPTENISACNLAFETFMEKVASIGHTATGMKGLGNLADVTAVTATTKAATGTTWAVATSVEIVADLHKLVDGVITASLETSQPDTIVLPLAQYQRANVVMSSALERTPLEIFRSQRPEVRRILVWDKLSTQGSGVTPCAMAWDSSDPFGPKMLVASEATYGTPLRQINGWLVPGKIRLAGVIARNPTCIGKMSGL